MAAEAARILQEWRRAERLLTVLPADAPERPEVEARLEEMRVLYQRVTNETVPSSDLRLRAAWRALERAQAHLDEVSRKFAAGDRA